MPEPVVHLARNSKRVAIGATGTAIITTAIVALAWFRPDVSPLFGATKPITCAALALLCLAIGMEMNPPPWRVVSRAAALVTGAIAGLTLAEYLIGGAFVGGTLLGTLVLGSEPTIDPRMSPYTCVALLFLSTGVALLTSRPADRQCPGQWLALIAMAIALLALIGHLYGVDRLHQFGKLSSMGPLTAVGVLSLSIAALFAHPDHEPVSMFLGQNLGGYVARRVVPAAIGFPVFVGWLRNQGEHAGYYSHEAGMAIFSIANVVFFAVLSGMMARRLTLIDRERGAVLQSLREREQTIAADEALLSAVLDAMPAAIFITDANGRVLRSNAWAGKVWGGPLPAANGISDYAEYKGWFPRTHRPLQAHDWTLARALREQRPVFDDLIEIERFGDREHRFILNSGAPVFGTKGELIGGVLASIDITDRERAVRQLHEAQRELYRHANSLETIVAERTAELTESVHELERFSYSLSHDLRAPLRAMMGFSQMLQGEYADKLDDVGRMYLDRIAAAAGRLDRLIQDVLTYSRIVRERIQLHTVDVDALLRQLIDENPALQEPRASVAIKAPLIPVKGHDAYLTQVLSNLLYNAVKFVAPGEKPRVEIWNEEREATIRIFVRDHGIGIPADVQHRLFEMFERLNRDYEGTGIGLSIVRKAVERMAGSVGVASEPGKGSTFWLDLQKG